MKAHAPLALSMALFGLLQEPGAPRVGRAFTERQVCEGKCCSLRMAVERRVPVFAGPAAPTTVLDWLAPGDTVLADIDVVRWSRVGAIVMLRPFKYFDEYNSVQLILEVGDTVPLLDYGGEGRYEIWHENAKRLVLLFWNDGSSFPPFVDPPARLLYYGQPALWLRVKGPSGVRGWIVRSAKLRQIGQVCS